MDSDLGRILEYLANLLPFSVNMMAAIRDYPHRCRVFLAVDREYVAGVLVEFQSKYNSQIWFDPIIWITGNSDDSARLLQERGYEKAIVISQTDFSSQMQGKSRETRVHEEYTMTVDNRQLHERLEFQDTHVRRLESKDAEESLLLWGIQKENIDPFKKKHEENFIRERTCLGLFANGQLVSRGAVMSVTEEYASVGAFFTIAGARRKGYGSAIVGEVLRKASATSRFSCLFVRSSNNDAISLYRKLGFKITDKAYFIDMGTGLMP